MRALALVLAGALVATPAAGSPRQEADQRALSQYLELPSEQVVVRRTTLLSTSLVLDRPASVLFQSDGTFAPASQGAAARIFVTADGRLASNFSTIDWRNSFDPVRHSFDAVGAARLAAGSHRIELVGEAIAGSFTVSQGSNLAVFVRPARHVIGVRRVHPGGPFAFRSLDLRGNALPHKRLLAVTVDAPKPVIALASGRSRVDRHDGDSMLGLYLDRRHPGPRRSLWSVNDTCHCAEVDGPVFTQAFLRGRRRSTVSLDASEFPWRSEFGQTENPAIYSVPPTASLVVLGGFGLQGAGAPALPGFPDLLGSAWDFACVGATSPWPGCAPTGTDILISSGSFVVPAGSPGVVMFLAKTRVQGDDSDAGGTGMLWISVDGVPRGSTGVQELRAPSSVSQRTVSASYLAAGARALAPGRHTVDVYGRADGDFVHLAFSRDLPLVWFD